MNPVEGADTLEKRLLGKAAAARAPINGSIEVSPLCNMNCAMCYVRLSPEEMKVKGRLHSVDEWLSVGREMKEAGVLFLLLTGGEPLTYPNFEELYLGLRQLGMILTINTNGTLLDEKWADFFKEYPPRRINLTFYGTSDEAYRSLCHYPDGFSKAMRAAELLRERGLQYRLNYSVTKDNLTDVLSFMQLAKKMGLAHGLNPYMIPAVRERDEPYDFNVRISPKEAAAVSFAISKVAEHNEEGLRSLCSERIGRIERSAAYFSEHPELAKPLPSICYGGRCSFSISWQGEMHPCVILTSPSANVFEMTFQDAWKSVVQGTEELYSPSKCSVCPRRFMCDICPAAALVETEKEDGAPIYLCHYMEELEKLYREYLAQGKPENM